MSQKEFYIGCLLIMLITRFMSFSFTKPYYYLTSTRPKLQNIYFISLYSKIQNEDDCEDLTEMIQ